MSSLVGVWEPFARQAIFAETPLRQVGSNDFATLEIRPGGTGYSRRRALFGRSSLSLYWEKDCIDDVYTIVIDNGFMVLLGYIEDDVLVTKIATKEVIPGLTGTGVCFRRIS